MLLECARPHCERTRLRELFRQPLDPSSLYAVADQHGLLPVLQTRLQAIGENTISLELEPRLQSFHREHALFTLQMSAELLRVLDRFRTTGIDTVCIKGAVLSVRCYDQASMRQFTDIDLIVRHRDIQQATRSMIALGYRPRVSVAAIQAAKAAGEYVFREPQTGIIVELHTERTFRYYPRRMPIETLFARKVYVRVDQQQVPALSLEDELVLICVHGAKHFWERLAWVADVAALLARPDVDSARAESAAREVGAERMLRIGVRLALSLCNAPVPPRVQAYAAADPAVARIVQQIAGRGPHFDSQNLGIVRRAAFRVRMRERLLPGLAYLARLTFLPTEDDSRFASASKLSRLADAVARPFRLALKYRHSGRVAAD